MSRSRYPKYEHYVGNDRPVFSENRLVRFGQSVVRHAFGRGPEYKARYERAPHAATPINPNSLMKDKRSYTVKAMEALEDRFGANLEERRLLGTAPNERVVELLKGSVLAALYQRLEKHNGITISPDADQDVVKLYEKACLGMTSANELIDLLIAAPEIKALELAKFSHPFEWLAKTVDIDSTIEDAIQHHSAEIQYKNPEYYISAIDNPVNPKTVTMVRKVYRGRIETDGDPVHVIQRDMFVLDLDHPDTQGIRQELIDWLENTSEKQYGKGGKIVPYPGEMLATFLNDQLDREEADSTSIEPGVRSYYAFRGNIDTIDEPT